MSHKEPRVRTSLQWLIPYYQKDPDRVPSPLGHDETLKFYEWYTRKLNETKSQRERTLWLTGISPCSPLWPAVYQRAKEDTLAFYLEEIVLSDSSLYDYVESVTNDAYALQY
jgi:hypothetical protein